VTTGSTGDTSKPLMLLLHGFPELWTMWEHQMSAFRDKYNVAAIDMRGYGQSGRPTVGPSSASQGACATCWQQPDRYSATRHPPPGCHRRGKHSRWSALLWLRPQARRDYYIDVLVADVVAVVLTLGYKTCVLAGHDWCATRRLPNDHPSPESACGWSSTAARACAVWCCACRVAALLPAAHGWPSMGSTCNRSRLSRAHAYMRSHCAGPGLIRSS